MANLKDKVALVTGASQGIGRAIAKQLATQGAHVILVAHDDEHLQQAFKELSRSGSASKYGLDLTDDTSVASMITSVLTEHDAIDILVNNAGVGGPTAPVQEVSLKEWDHTLSINLRVPFLLSRGLAPAMIASGTGKIINISSIAGKMAYPLRTPYAASKWGLIGLTLTLAQELGPENIQVNAICPGPTQTDLIQAVIQARAEATGKSFDDMAKEYVKATALKRMVQPSEIAQLVSYLCSDEAEAITGQAIDVSAGYGLRIGD